MNKKSVRNRYNFTITYKGNVYIDLLPKINLEEIDLEYHYKNNFKTEYDLLIYLLEKHNVKVPIEIFNDLGVEISYYAKTKRKTIKPLYKDDYFSREQVIKDASFFSLRFPALFRELLRKYRFGYHHPEIVRRAIETKENVYICDKKVQELERKIKRQPNNERLKLEMFHYKDAKAEITYDFFNDTYNKANYREIRDAYFITKPYKAFYLEKLKRIASNQKIKTSKP